MFRHTLPPFTSTLYPSLVWNIATKQREVYLTFDDGPHPTITDEVLQMLSEYKAKATFFCVGDNVLKYPEVVARIRVQGHALGNHTFHHLNGWKIDLQTYLSDVQRCADVLPTKLFRPPYGRITREQIQLLRTQYQIIMWSILTRDYDKSLDITKAAHTCAKALRPGSIVVLHDSEKAYHQMKYLLKHLLHVGTQNGFVFKALTA